MDELHYQLDLLKALNQKVSSDEKMYRKICETSNDAFIYYDFIEDQLVTLGKWENFFPFQIRTIPDFENLYDIVEDEDAEELRRIISLEKKLEAYGTKAIKLKNKKAWYECEVSVSYTDEGKPLDKVIRFCNITKLQSKNDELYYMAYYDVFTGLYNRNNFISTLTQWIAKAKKELAIIAVMFLDIDNFRTINDGQGIEVGDELVQVFGQYLKEFQNEQVLVSHFNSDIYCIALYDPCGNRSVEAIYNRIRERLKTPFILTGRQEISISISIGVAEFPEAAYTALELINNAEIVMFKVKNTGKNAIGYFDAPIINQFIQEAAIENKLKDAIIDNRFVLYYQPQYSSYDNSLRGMEALIRWIDEDGTMINPMVFIPVAEQNGTIVTIGDWVIEEAVKQYAIWNKKYGIDYIMSINISSIQFHKFDFVDKLIDTLKSYDVNPSCIELEVTESVLIEEFDDIMKKLWDLREYGVRVSLDDFGTGFSSLSYLKGLPIQTLKIDKVFIDKLKEDEASQIITEAIVNMVEKLGFETIAEGVETKEQLDFLREIHCANIQGFLLGKPMPAEDMDDLLQLQC